MINDAPAPFANYLDILISLAESIRRMLSVRI